MAIIESNAWGTVIPASNPVSSRTPGPDGGFHAVIVPGAGMKFFAGSSALIRNSIECPRARRVVVAERLALGDAEHLPDQVEPGDLLADRVLDLQPGVDLEEADGAVLADEELAGARADVAGLAARSSLEAR